MSSSGVSGGAGVLAPFFDRRKILFNRIEVRRIRRQKEERVASLVDQLLRLFRFMKGGVIHNEG